MACAFFAELPAGFVGEIEMNTLLAWLQWEEASDCEWVWITTSIAVNVGREKIGPVFALFDDQKH